MSENPMSGEAGLTKMSKFRFLPSNAAHGKNSRRATWEPPHQFHGENRAGIDYTNLDSLVFSTCWFSLPTLLVTTA